MPQGLTPRVWVLSPPFQSEGPKGWVAGLPADLHGFTDNNEQPRVSRLRLLEDGNRLGPAHSAHNAIRTLGDGRHSFWTNVVYFSTSDGSDPTSNGRLYTVQLLPLEESAELERPVASRVWQAPSRPLRCAIYGLGNRGLGLAALARSMAGVEIAWVVDQSADRIAETQKKFGADIVGTTDILEPLADPKVDIVVVAVPDNLHRAVAEPAFLAGKRVFLEKPLATTAEDAKAILQAWKRSRCILQLGYVLRQAPFYAAIREIVRKGTLGAVRMASLSEQLDLYHGASFMRRWHADSANSGGLIVHKACHDLDIICWILDAKPRLVGSLGGLDTFIEPAPAPFCSRCARNRECLYVDKALHERRTVKESADPTAYGLDRCVFHPDKDIIDNQVVSFLLDTGTRGSFHLSMQGPVRSERRITLVGDRGTLDGTFEDGQFTVAFTDAEREPFHWSAEGHSTGGHGGGDRVTMFDFLDACAGRSPPPIESVEETLRGLVFALAAEQARKGETLVRLQDAEFSL
jgi:predicted dehydrogenase